MLRKWVDRVIAVFVAFIIIGNTRMYFVDQAIPYAAAQAEQKAIWEAKKEANIKRAEEEALKKIQEETSVSVEDDTMASVSVEEPETEPEFEPSEATGDDFYLDLAHYSLWESGEYLIETGEKADHKRRLRYPEYVEITCPEYFITLSDGYSLYICEYNSEKEFVRSLKCANSEKYSVSKEGAFFTVTLRRDEGEKSLSPGQWRGLFNEGIDAAICTEKWLDYSVSDLGALIGGGKSDYETSELSDLLLEGEDDKLADVLWNMQVANGVYTMSGEEIDNGRLTYYVSSSEGDDSNTGLDREHPKKTLDAFSGLTGVNVLLKCGDEFPISKEFSIKKNSMFGAYGEGKRPVLDYYRKMDKTFYMDEQYNNLWIADLSDMNIVTENKNKANCNIGQLLVDNDVNWKRVVWSSKTVFDKEDFSKRPEGCWAVDWVTSKLYINTSNNPNELDIKYAPPITAISIDDADDVVIKGLEIRGSGKHGINISDSTNIKVECCYINHIGGSILVQQGVRYGNAIQIWNSGKGIIVNNNYVAWIFDTCFTNQGSASEAICENILFENNVGAHFFWGIETWGDSYSDNGFKNIMYKGNILFDNIDVTNPLTPMHAGPNTRLLGVSDDEYESYRNGYRYHQMAGVNASNSGTGDIVQIQNNIIWNTNRFLVLATNSRDEERFSALKNNLLYATTASDKACLLRMTEKGEKKYCRTGELLDESNFLSVHVMGDGYDNNEEINKLSSHLYNIGSDFK